MSRVQKNELNEPNFQHEELNVPHFTNWVQLLVHNFSVGVANSAHSIFYFSL